MIDPMNPYTTGQTDDKGRLIVYDPQMDPENRPFVAPPMFAGMTLDQRADVKARRRAIRDLEAVGLKVPKSVSTAVDKYEAVLSTRIHPTLPDTSGMSVEELREAIHEYALLSAKREHTEDAVARFAWQVGGEVHREFLDLIDPVIEHIRPEFDRLAGVFTDAYAKIRGFKTIAEAAQSTDPVENVKAWTDAGLAALRLTELSHLVLEVRREPHERSSRSNVRRVHTLVTVQQVVGLRDGKQERGRHNALESPLGLWPFILDRGLPIALAEDLDEWDERQAGSLVAATQASIDEL